MTIKKGCFQVLGGFFLGLFLCTLCFVAILFYRSPNSYRPVGDQASFPPRSTATPLRFTFPPRSTPRPTSSPTATPTDEDILQSIIFQVTGADEILFLFHYTDIVTVRYPATTGLSGTDRQFLEMICAMREAGFTSHEFRFDAIITAYDAGGNPYDVEGLEMFIRPDAAARINCGSLNRVDLPALAYVYDIHPAFY